MPKTQFLFYYSVNEPFCQVLRIVPDFKSVYAYLYNPIRGFFPSVAFLSTHPRYINYIGDEMKIEFSED